MLKPLLAAVFIDYLLLEVVRSADFLRKFSMKLLCGVGLSSLNMVLSKLSLI